MRTQATRRGDSLYIYLTGELDEHSVADARAEADGLIDESAGLSRAVFNLAGVKFMDSTGIGFLIGRYKRLKRYGMSMYLEIRTRAQIRSCSSADFTPSCRRSEDR